MIRSMVSKETCFFYLRNVLRLAAQRDPPRVGDGGGEPREQRALRARADGVRALSRADTGRARCRECSGRSGSGRGRRARRTGPAAPRRRGAGLPDAQQPEQRAQQDAPCGGRWRTAHHPQVGPGAGKGAHPNLFDFGNITVLCTSEQVQFKC